MNKDGKSFLDIGAGIGFSGLVAKEYGLNETLIEPNPVLFNYMNSHHKVKCENSYFPLANSKAKYDFIFCDNVIEHVYNPKPFIDSIMHHLNHKGVLFIAFPPVDWLRLFFEKVNIYRKLKFLKPFRIAWDLDQHVNYFTVESLTALLYDHKSFYTLRSFHHHGWSIPVHKLLNLSTGQFFVQKK